MSAIYGIINKDGKPVDPEMVQKMKQAMQHRSNDGSKELICDNAAFGFCQLVVYPNQEHEQLPIQNGDLLFTANAHLHNRDELINKLGLDKLQYATTPDSYLILQAYKKWGVGCVQYLDGEYVYAIWNKLSRELFISNDHIGFKSVYYYDSPEQFIFCSEIKGIEAVKTTPNYFDEECLIQALIKRRHGDSTYNQDIKLLTGAATLIINRIDFLLSRYWRLESKQRYSFANQNEWYAGLQCLLSQAVYNRLSEVNRVGVSLSGGLDSASITCFLSSLLKKKNLPLYAFSSVLPEGSVSPIDERRYIEIVGKHCGNIVHTYVEANGANPFLDIEKAFEIEESIPNSFFYMDHAILNAAKAEQVKLLFSGMGGDFYVSSQGHTVLYNLVKNLRFKKALYIARKRSIVTESSVFNIMKSELLPYLPGIREYLRSKRSNNIKNYLQFPIYKKIKKRINSPVSDEHGFINSGASAKLMSRLQNSHESFGITPGIPLLDKHILEFMSDVPSELILAGGHKRGFFRKAMEGVLPPSIQWRLTKAAYVPDHEERALRSLHRVDLRKPSELQNKYIRTAGLEELVGKCVNRNVTPQELLLLVNSIISLYALDHLRSKYFNFK